MNEYINQYSKMIRRYKKFESINNGIIHDENSNNYTDRMLDFFRDCYCLKEYVINDPTSPYFNKNQDVENFINQSFYLRICADFCNKDKHLKLTKPARIDKNIKAKETHHNLNVFNGIYSAKLVIEVCGLAYDAFDVATHCIEEWKNFLHIK